MKIVEQGNAGRSSAPIHVAVLCISQTPQCLYEAYEPPQQGVTHSSPKLLQTVTPNTTWTSQILITTAVATNSMEPCYVLGWKILGDSEVKRKPKRHPSELCVYWGSIFSILKMENTMEATIVYWGYNGLYWYWDTVGCACHQGAKQQQSQLPVRLEGFGFGVWVIFGERFRV